LPSPPRAHTPAPAAALAKAALRAAAPALLALGCASTVASPPAHAEGKRTVGSISASGLVFKDKLIIDAFSDPKVEGVTLYVSDFERPVTERLQKDFFSDPSQSGLACARRAEVKMAANVDTSPEGEDVVTEAKSLLFKTLKVRRVVDKATNTLVYVSYSDRLNKGDDANKARFASSLCTVSMD
jgi:catabolite regulation protein CreA